MRGRRAVPAAAAAAVGEPRKKKRVHPPRKIVPRGRMGVGWIVAPVVLAALILVAGLALMLTRTR